MNIDVSTDISTDISTGPSELDKLLGATPPQQRRRYKLSVLLLIAAVIVAMMLFARLFYGTSSPYYTDPVMRGDITPQIVARGTLHGAGEVVLTAAREGTIVAVPDPAVARLSAGQVLVTMDTQAIRRALDADSADATLADSAVNRAQATVQEAQQRLDRYEGVWRRSGQRVPSLNEMENARSDVARAGAELVDARTRQAAGRQKMADDRADLDGAIARAPFAAWLIGCQVQTGQWVRAGQPLCVVVAHPGQLSVFVPVSAADSARLQAGATARILADGVKDGEFAARLARIERAQNGQGGQGVQAVAIFTLILPPDGQGVRWLIPGRGVNVRIVLPDHQDVLLVPDAALSFSPHGEGRNRPAGVYVLADSGDAPRFVPVALGVGDGRRTEIVSGDLKPGDQVIIGWRREGSG